MINNYLKIAVRNLIKLKQYTAINIFGLAIGMAACLFIIQYIRSELRVDKHHEYLDQLFKVNTTFYVGDNQTRTSTTPSPMAWTLVQDYPEVKQAARLLSPPGVDQFLVRYQDRSFFEKKGFMVDSTFFDVLTFHFVEGSVSTAVRNPYNVVISDQLKAKLFGDRPALGETVEISSLWGSNDYEISGVIDLGMFPSHLDGELYINMRSGAIGDRFYALDEWAGNNLYHTYIKLNQDANPEILESKFPALVEAKAGERLKLLGFNKFHFLEPVKDIYLKSDVQYQIGPNGDIDSIYLLGVIALFILVIACINFMNLATAKAMLRFREVAIRKVIGANRRILSGQFYTEAFLYTGIAIVFSTFLIYACIPWFNLLSGKIIEFNILGDWQLPVWMLIILILASAFVGSYPALYLPSLNPANIFQGKMAVGLSAKQMRRGLVVLQFIVSIALIQGIFVIQQQMGFIREKKLGYSSEEKLVVPMNTESSMENVSVLKNEFLSLGNVRAAGTTTAIPGQINFDDMLVYGEGRDRDDNIFVNVHWVDPEYLQLMEFELLEGRFFDRNRLSDTVRSVIVTENILAGLGYTREQAVGKKLYWTWDEETHEHEIIGIVEDFHMSSFRDEMRGQIFFWDDNSYTGYLVAAVNSSDIDGTIGELQQKWDVHNPAEPFEFYFLDDGLQKAYESDHRLAGLISAFTILAIFISCLGLFGLAAFAAERRGKEISIRKVLGASVQGIVSLLVKDFLFLVLVALIIATPIAWFFMTRWLMGFHYHTALSWSSFVLAGIIAIGIAFLTVGYQSIRAALTNPVEKLGVE
jgi:putative ABC transport system permease protein